MAEPNFEKDLETLEKIVEALEDGELSLDEALKQFEEGIRLTQRCEKALTGAERRIELLTRGADGELQAVPFEEETGEESAPVEEAPAPPAPARKAKAPAPKETLPIDEGQDDDDALLF